MTSNPHPSPEPSKSPSVGGGKLKKPRLALFLATSCGLGYIPIAPGTFGSLAGLLLALAPYPLLVEVTFRMNLHFSGAIASLVRGLDPVLSFEILVTVAAAIIGVWTANRAAAFWNQKDPQRVVIDEVSGQHLALLLGCGVPVWWKLIPPTRGGFPLGLITSHTELGWKYLLLGLILFRVFDIWKPFPVRQAESLRGGWGIMADDWVAGIYAGLCLWAARGFGL
jgi:phosphatidylglycerophosphatase A